MKVRDLNLLSLTLGNVASNSFGADLSGGANIVGAGPKMLFARHPQLDSNSESQSTRPALRGGLLRLRGPL
jgi:hypothetical protein